MTAERIPLQDGVPHACRFVHADVHHFVWGAFVWGAFTDRELSEKRGQTCGEGAQHSRNCLLRMYFGRVTAESASLLSM